jgi:hypothetical protein
MSEQLIGRLPFVPTEEQRHLVGALAGLGVPQPVICSLIGIGSHHMLRRAFKDELAHAREKLIAAMGVTLVRQALGGNVQALK